MSLPLPAGAKLVAPVKSQLSKCAFDFMSMMSWVPGAQLKATKPPFGHDLGVAYFATVVVCADHSPVPPSPSAKTNLVVIGANVTGAGGGDAAAGGGGGLL